MSNGQRRRIAERPHGQKHQAHKEKGCEQQDAVDHFPFGNEVHEIAGDQKGFAGGNE